MTMDSIVVRVLAMILLPTLATLAAALPLVVVPVAMVLINSLASTVLSAHRRQGRADHLTGCLVLEVVRGVVAVVVLGAVEAVLGEAVVTLLPV